MSTSPMNRQLHEKGLGGPFETDKQCSTTSQNRYEPKHDCSDCHPVYCTICIHNPNTLPAKPLFHIDISPSRTELFIEKKHLIK
jgi:hypothetical protein